MTNLERVKSTADQLGYKLHRRVGARDTSLTTYRRPGVMDGDVGPRGGWWHGRDGEMGGEGGRGHMACIMCIHMYIFYVIQRKSYMRFWIYPFLFYFIYPML